MHPEIEMLEFNTTLIECDTTATSIFDDILRDHPNAYDSITCNIPNCEKSNEMPVPIIFFTFTTNNGNLNDL